MAQSLKQRVGTIISGSVHALLDNIEDIAPISMLEQKVRELESLADEVRSELGKVAANRHIIQQQHVNLNQEHAQLAQAVELAVQNQRDDLAQTAIARQLDIEAQLPILEGSLGDLSKQSQELTSFVDALMSKRREMSQAIEQLQLAQKTTQSAVPTPSNHSFNAKVDGVQTAFDEIYRRATGTSALAAQATVEQNTNLKELRDMVRAQNIADRLSHIKKTHRQ